MFKMSASRTRVRIGMSPASRPTFSETVIVSVGVSKLGCTELFLSRDAMHKRGLCCHAASVVDHVNE